MKKILSFIFLFHVLSLSAAGRDDAKLIQRDLWRNRAEQLTNNLLKDASNSEVLDRALLMAQLSDLWWESERTQANTWIQKSVDALSFYPSAEAKEQREEYFRVVRQVLALISTHNKKQSTRLVEILSQSEKDIPDNEKKLNAEALIEQALRIVKTDAPQATKLGLRALALDFPANSYKLAWDLRRDNPDFANQFFRAALAHVTGSPETVKLYVLQQFAFPELSYPDFPYKLLPPLEVKVAFLNFVADYLYQRQLRFSSKAIPSCSDEAVFTTKLRNSFTDLLPQKSPMVGQAIDICLSHLKPQTKQLLNSPSGQKSNVEELLIQADGIQGDSLLRGRLLLNAAFAATQQKKFTLAVQVLEKMSNEERKVDIDFWNDLRLDSGAVLAVAEFKEGDLTRAHKTLKELPDALRPLGQISFVLQISPEDLACSQFCADLLNEARRDIVKSDLPFLKKSSYWLSLVKLYSVRKLQTEAAGAFRELVTAFNSGGTDENLSNKGAISSQFLTDSKRIIPGFSLTLIEAKEDSMLESVGLLNDQKLRTQMNLEFLRMSLRKYQSLKIELEKSAEVRNQN